MEALNSRPILKHCWMAEARFMARLHEYVYQLSDLLCQDIFQHQFFVRLIRVSGAQPDSICIKD